MTEMVDLRSYLKVKTTHYFFGTRLQYSKVVIINDFVIHKQTMTMMMTRDSASSTRCYTKIYSRLRLSVKWVTDCVQDNMPDISRGT